MREIRSLRDGRMAAAVLAVLLASSRAAAQPSPSAPPPASEPAPQPSTAPAAQPPLQVEWNTNDPGCVGADVDQRALRLVASGVVPRPLIARVDVERHAEAWLVRIETRSVDGEHAGRRELRAESCEHLERAVVLLLAMTLESRDLDAALPPAPSPAEPAPEPAPPPLSAPEPSQAPEPPGEPTPPPSADGVPIGWFLRVDGRAGVGLKPGLAFGTGLAGGLRFGSLDLGVAGAYWPVTREPVPGSADANTLIQRASAGIRACWSFGLVRHFVLAPCIIPEAVVFITGAEGVNDPDDGPKTPILSLTGALELRYALAGDRLSILLGAAVTGEPRQPFRLRPQNIDDTADGGTQPVTVYETKGVGPRLELGLDARF